MGSTAMIKKLQSTKGANLIIWILVAAIIVMLVLILAPNIGNVNSYAKDKVDAGHEQTARDSAHIRFMTEGPFTAIYDSENKQFIDDVSSARAFGSITAYGEADNHIGKVILVSVSDDGTIMTSWIGPEDYMRVNR